MNYKKTKIICTLGPASWDYPVLKKIAEAGMNVARLNMSHGTHSEKSSQIQIIRRISQELNKPLAIIADLQGPKLRLGTIDGTKQINQGDKVNLSLNPVLDEIPIQFDLTPFIKKNHRIFLNDGLIELKVLNIANKTIHAVAQNSGWISSHKGVNVPDTYLKGAAFTQKDIEDAEFAIQKQTDYLALSFVQTADDLKKPRELIKKYKSKTKLIAKIEKKEAVENLEEIIRLVDAIMVARGDLGIETPASEVPLIQQKIIRLARQHQKPVTICTQMLESMVENPRPTRAEASDVANAVLDQVDAVMLSAETTVGKYPIETVKIMKDIILNVEENPDYKNYIKINWQTLQQENYLHSAIASSAASLAYRLNAKAIVVPTASGKTARLLSSFRPDADIVAVCHDEKTMNQLALVWGLRSVLTTPTGNFEKFLQKAIDTVIENGFAKKGDKIIIVTGSTVGLSGSTDTIKVITI